MAVFMEDYSNLDELVDSKAISEKKANDAKECRKELDVLKYEDKLGRVKYRVEQFIIKNRASIDSEIINKLEAFINTNDKDGKQLSHEILDYLDSFEDKQKEEKDNKEDEIKEEKEDFVERTLNELKAEGHNINGSIDEITNSIESEEDIERIHENVEEVLNADLENTLELDVKDIAKATETNDNTTLIDNTAIKQDIPQVDASNGAITLKANVGVPMHNNYVAMLAYLTVAPDLFNNTILNNNLDLSITNTGIENEYQVKCGKFPTATNGLELESLDQIKTCLDNFNPDIDYSARLEQLAPEVNETFNMVREHFVNKGDYKVMLKNKDGKHNIGFKMDENFNEVTEAFSHSGAYVSNDEAENSVVRMPEDSLFVLRTTNEELNALKHEKENEASNSMKQNFQKLKTFEEAKPVDMKEAGAVTPIFLTVVAIAEAILLGFYFTMMFR